MAVLIALAPLSASAGDDDVELPFLLADGAVRPSDETVPLILPRWQRGEGDDQAEPPGPRFPLLREVLRPFPDARLDARRGRVALPEEPRARERLERLLGAVRAGFTTTVAIDVEVTHGDLPPTRLVGRAPVGTELSMDGREHRAHPSGVDLAPTYVHAAMQDVAVGPRIVASVVQAGAHWILRLEVHVSRELESVRFEAEDFAFAAPRLGFSALVAELPAASGRTESLSIDDLRIAWTVTPVDAPVAPRGTRLIRTDAATPRHGALSLPDPGVVPFDGEAVEHLSDPRTLQLPAPGEGVTTFPVRPGAVVWEGAEDHLTEATRRLDDAWHRLRAPARLAFETASGLRVEVPVTRPAPLVYVAGHLDPVVLQIPAEISTDHARAAPRPAMRFSGRTLTVTFDGDVPRLREAFAARDTSRPRRVGVVVHSSSGERRVARAAPSATPQTSTITTRPLTADEVSAWSVR